jgi:hypothetical protein
MNAVVETKKEADLTEIETDDLIEELEERGHTVDAELHDFDDEEICKYLAISDSSGVDWADLYQKIVCGNAAQAFEEFKQIIQDRTGRIIV